VLRFLCDVTLPIRSVSLAAAGTLHAELFRKQVLCRLGSSPASDQSPACHVGLPESSWTAAFGDYCNGEPGRPLFVSLILYLDGVWPRENDGETLFLDSGADVGIIVRPKRYRAVLMDQVFHKRFCFLEMLMPSFGLAAGD